MCLEFSKNKLTYSEALRNLKELSLDPVFVEEHLDSAIDYVDAVELKNAARERHEQLE